MQPEWSLPRSESLRIDLSARQANCELVVWTVNVAGSHTVQHVSEWPLGPGQLERVSLLVRESVRQWWRPTLFASDLAEFLEDTAAGLRRP